MSPSRPSKALRTISIGGATFDLFVRTAKDAFPADATHTVIPLPVGHKIRVEDVVEAFGGGAANTSVGLARLGIAAGFAGILGSDQWGERLLKNLKKENVNVGSATIIEGETSSFSIILNTGSGDRVILYSTGANAHLHDATFDLAALEAADWVYFNHIHEKSCVIQDDLIRVLREKRNLCMTWNPGGRQLKHGMEDSDNKALLRRTTLLLLNKEEALMFTGKTTIPRAIAALSAAGVAIPCITDGSNGSWASDGRTLYHCPSIKEAKIVDTTGAGDAFGTAATWSLLQDADLPKMLKAGTINATSVLASIGAETGLLTDIEMQKTLRQTLLTVDVKPLRA